MMSRNDPVSTSWLMPWVTSPLPTTLTTAYACGKVAPISRAASPPLEAPKPVRVDVGERVEVTQGLLEILQGNVLKGGWQAGHAVVGQGEDGVPVCCQ
jgi:hypothetical protein